MPSPEEITLRSVTVLAGVVVAFTFIFGFGNVWTLALRLGVPAWVAPLVAPAVDLSILRLLLGTRHLALHGATADQLRPARRLLIFSSLVTLALNVADPLIAGEVGKAAFDSVGPLLLIGWAEVGPGLLQAIGTISRQAIEVSTTLPGDDEPRVAAAETGDDTVDDSPTATNRRTATLQSDNAEGPTSQITDGDLLGRAKQEDTRHWAAYQRPISAETLRRNLRIGAARARMLVSIVRAERSSNPDRLLAATSHSEPG
ncbi:MAG: hypothetical protein ACRDQY_24995 [Pseudonocardiaceae bacterium]